MSKFIIPAGRFLSFSCPVDASEKHINRLYEIIRYRFIPSSPFVYDDKRPNIEIFPLEDGENFEILIPIKSK